MLKFLSFANFGKRGSGVRGKTCCLLLCSKGNENLPKIKNKDRFCLDGMADQARPEPQARHMAADQSRKSDS